jgi:hypothetical protein
MISAWGYRTLDPLCVSAPGNCGATFAGSAHKFPAARGPPLGERSRRQRADAAPG